METIFLVCATLGGTLLVCQVLLSLLGLGHHHEIGGEHLAHAGDHHDSSADHGHRESWFISILTFRTVVAALAVFGLAGLTASAEEFDGPATLIIALAAAAGVVALLAFMMQSLQNLRSDGTVRIERAVGKVGTVYLPIPAEKAGPGKVVLKLQNRTVEYQAVTAREALATGDKVVVVAVVSPDTLEVTKDKGQDLAVPMNLSETCTDV
jgi:hypothetical protein